MRKIITSTGAGALVVSIIQGRRLLILIFVFLFCSELSYSAGFAINERTRIYTQEITADSLLLKIDNTLSVPVSAKLDLVLENLRTDAGLQFSAIVPANTRGYTLAGFRKHDSAIPYRCSYQWRIVVGDVSKVPDMNYVYAYPFSKGSNYRVSQGPGGDISHKEMFAFDFAMPVGTMVTAARDGIVALTKSDSRLGGPDKKFLNDANFISIYHSDGTIANYLHLNTDGVLVKEGQWVKKGEPIGFSGNTGFSSGPHLHFEVTQTGSDFEKNKWVTFLWETRQSGLLSSLIKSNFISAMLQRKL